MSKIPPGPYFYVDDQPDAEPVACDVFEAEGALWARFPRTPEGDGAELLVSEMPGRFLHHTHVGASAVPAGGADGRVLH